MMRKLLGTGLLGFGLAVLAMVSPAAACGPSQPLSTAALLDFQTGLIDRGLARESLTEAQKTEIAVLRAQVVAAHKAGRREDAKSALLKIVAMFKQKEVFGAVEPIVPGCAPMRAAVMTGALIGITIKPSQPGTRCGNHYVLSVMEGVRKGKTIKVNVYDLAKVPYDGLESMVGKTVEVETLGGSAVTAIRLAGQPGNAQAGLAGLSAVNQC